VPKGATVKRISDDRAVLTGRAVFSVTMGGYKGEYRLAFTEAYVRKNGGWMLVELLTSTY
jgi:hypothetical protein